MKSIGEGWQYTVYDIGNGRVLKKYHSIIKSYWVIAKTIFPFNVDPFWKIPFFSWEMKKKALSSFRIIEKREIPLKLIGNPYFLNDLDFEQDKVKPLHDVFDSSNIDDMEEAIEKFIELNKRFLSLGVIDKSFNITKNYGLTVDNKIILVDIAELLDDPIKIKKQITKKAWEANYVAGCIKSEGMRKYFIDQMDKNFNPAR